MAWPVLVHARLWIWSIETCMRALSIRQPFAELILRGIKTIEYRSRATKIIGERFHIYASKWQALRQAQDRGIWSGNLSTTGEAPVPRWMLELAEQIKLIPPAIILPRGVIVGSAVIWKCEGLRDEGTKGQSE